MGMGTLLASSSFESPVVRPRRRRRRRGLGAIAALPVAIGLIAVSAVVWRSSSAAFSGTTNNAGNSWATGTVSLTDDDSGTAMFAATGLVPGATDSKCIAVTYGGTADAQISLFVSASTGPALQPYLDMVVEEGTGGSFSSCAGFIPSTTLSSAPLSSIVATNTSFASGMTTGGTATTGQVRTYRFTYTLNASTPDAQQGATATATFQWEARTS